MSSREAEADALMKSGKKHTEKSFFKWKPNWDSAATDYEKAANIYSHMSLIEKARDAWSKASHAHDKAGNPFFAARAMENLANLLAEHSKAQTDLLQCALEAYAEAGNLFALDGKFDRQAKIMMKSVQLLRPASASSSSSSSAIPQLSSPVQVKDLSRVTDMLKKAVDILEEHEEDKTYLTYLPDMYHAWMLTHLRAGDIPGAVSVLERVLGIAAASQSSRVSSSSTARTKGLYERLSQPHNAAKAGLEIIVLCLSLGDAVWARQLMERMQDTAGFTGSKEERAASALLVCYEERDVEQLAEAMRDTTLQFITSDISRMAKKLKIQGGEARGGPAAGEEERLPDLDPEEDIR